MPFTINGQPIHRARLTVPRHYVWEGEVAVAGPLELPAGAPVTLVLGDTTFVGHIVTGGTFLGASESTYTIAGGAGGWARTVLPRPYAVPGGVHVATIAAALALEAGERLDLGGFDLILGDHWTRPAGAASVALSAMIPALLSWRVDPDGVTRVGPRPPAPVPPGLPLAVEDYEPALRRARVSLPGDNVSALLPGAILTAPNLLAPLVVGEATIRASQESVTIDILGEGGLVEMLAAIVDALTAWRTFTTTWTYQVVGADPGKPTLQALQVAPGLPPVISCDKLFGLPGVTATLAPGALVVVGFRDANPGRPYIATYMPGVFPLAVTLVAPTVALGSSAGAEAVSLAGGLTGSDAHFETVRAAINTIAPGTLPTPFPTTGATRVSAV